METLNLINLEHRSERLERIMNMFNGNPYFNINLIPAVRHEKGGVGCTLSHAKAIRLGINQGDDFVAVIEDDCMLNDRFSLEYIHNIIKELRDNLEKWEVFNGAPNFWSKRNDLESIKVFRSEVGDKFSTMSWGQSTHFMLYNKSIFSKILNLFETIEDHTDLIISRNFLQTVHHPGHLFYQMADYSDITKNTNSEWYEEFQKNHEILLKGLADESTMSRRWLRRAFMKKSQ